MKGIEQWECQNFIEVLQPNPAKNNSLYVCGTNAQTPLCRDFTVSQDHLQMFTLKVSKNIFLDLVLIREQCHLMIIAPQSITSNFVFNMKTVFDVVIITQFKVGTLGILFLWQTILLSILNDTYHIPLKTL